MAEKRRRAAFRLAKVAAFIAMAAPGVLLLWDATHSPLRANPYPTLIRESGLWSMRLLVLGLAVSPLRAMGWTAIMRLRRMIGLFAAFYAAAHLVIWAKDYDFDWPFLAREIVARNFLTVGFVATLLLVPLTLTSTRGAIRRMGGRAWQRLHRLVYPAAIIAWVHFWMAGRLTSQELVIEALALALVLLWRLRPATAQGAAA